MSEPIEEEDFEKKIKEANKRIAEIKKKYDWMDMRTEREKEWEIKDLCFDLSCIAEDFDEDPTYDPHATKITDFNFDIQEEIENGIKNHDKRLAKISESFNWMVMEPTIKTQKEISDQVETINRSRISGPSVYRLLLKLKQDFPNKNEKELLAEAYRIFKEDISDFSFSGNKKWYTGSLTEYLDKWKENLEKYLKEGLSWEEALMRIKREERTGKERIGNEQERNDVKWKSPEDFDEDDERMKIFEDFSRGLQDLKYKLGLEDAYNSMRKKRDTDIMKWISDYENEKNVKLDHDDFLQLYEHLDKKYEQLKKLEDRI